LRCCLTPMHVRGSICWFCRRVSPMEASRNSWSFS
jgi:hypothetical protein